jgi:hypothetical protein
MIDEELSRSSGRVTDRVRLVRIIAVIVMIALELTSGTSASASARRFTQCDEGGPGTSSCSLGWCPYGPPEEGAPNCNVTCGNGYSSCCLYDTCRCFCLAAE